ncbi:MAG: tetratricopeptide repeat protein [Halieaceae bacterium]|nr:tetratricopeptide repeat protein [Halieaceae bacterium]
METYRTEEEQVEALKKWWQENGRSTIIGVVLALGLGFGWQAWQKSQEQAVMNASTLYQQMLSALSVEDGQGVGPAMELARRIKDEYRGSSYARFAALHLARVAVNDGDLSAAEDELRWVIAMSDRGDDLERIANLRLARVLAARGATEEALGLLDTQSATYVASYAIARGDILLAQERNEEALAAFETAASSLDPDRPLPQTLRDKLEYLRALQGGEAS